MPFVDRIEIRAHSRATEVVDRVKEACLNLIPEDFRETIRVTSAKTEGHLLDPIIVVTAVVKRRKQCAKVFDFIISNFSESDRETMLQSLELRLDDRCVFFLRIDKQAVFLHEVKLSTDPDMISIRIHLREYPRCNWANALSFLKTHLESTGEKTDAI